MSKRDDGGNYKEASTDDRLEGEGPLPEANDKGEAGSADEEPGIRQITYRNDDWVEG